MGSTANVTTDRRIAYIIFNSIPPYAYEANNILALPNGMPYRARFRRAWHPDIKAPSEIENRDTLLVLRNWDTAQLVPLRRVRTGKVQRVGKIYYINYVLGDIVEYDSAEATRTQQVQDFNDKIALELKGYANTPKSNLDKLVFLAPDLAASIADSQPPVDKIERESDNWGKVVDLLESFDVFLDVDFIKIIGMANNAGKSSKLVFAEGTVRYQLKNDSTYTLEVFQRSNTRKTGDSSVSTRSITIGGEPDAVRIIKGNFAITGKYDRFEFRFRTSIRQRSRDTELPIDVTRTGSTLIVPTVTVPIRIETSSRHLVVQIAAAVTFVAAVFALLFSDSWFPQQVDLAQRISILALILSAPEARELVRDVLSRLNLNRPEG